MQQSNFQPQRPAIFGTQVPGQGLAHTSSRILFPLSSPTNFPPPPNNTFPNAPIAQPYPQSPSHSAMPVTGYSTSPTTPSESSVFASVGQITTLMPVLQRQRPPQILTMGNNYAGSGLQGQGVHPGGGLGSMARISTQNMNMNMNSTPTAFPELLSNGRPTSMVQPIRLLNQQVPQVGAGGKLHGTMAQQAATQVAQNQMREQTMQFHLNQLQHVQSTQKIQQQYSGQEKMPSTMMLNSQVRISPESLCSSSLENGITSSPSAFYIFRRTLATRRYPNHSSKRVGSSATIPAATAATAGYAASDSDAATSTDDEYDRSTRGWKSEC